MVPPESPTASEEPGASRRPDVGARIGRFVVLGRVGEGGMGVVYVGYDLQLDRKVAIKILRATPGDAAIRGRALREAQALARLSHPNVVQVYEVGEHDGQLFVAMEFIAGEDLRGWLGGGVRRWQEVLEIMLSAGRGLAAAHAHGLIHRDVKPDNILVGADGRARIADFGLVRSADDDPRASASVSETGELVAALRSVGGEGIVDARLTQQGRAVGTAAYMSPEQHITRDIDARADQFSFCVTLFEGVYGLRPFDGKTWSDLKRQVMRGTLVEAPRELGVPRWLHRVIARGLSPLPDERWPSMDALLAALADDPIRRWRRVASIVAAIAAVAAVAYGVAAFQSARAVRCDDAAAELTEVWDEGRREALRARWTALDQPLSRESLPRIEAALDDYAGAWIRTHEESCRAHLRGTMSSTLLDRGARCLGERRAALASMVEVLTEAESPTRAVQAALELPRVEPCGDPAVLLAEVPPPEDPRVAAEVAALRLDLARLESLWAAGRVEAVPARLAELAPRVLATEYPPLVAELHLRRGRVALQHNRWDEAQRENHEAALLALKAGSDRIAAQAMVAWVYVVGYGLTRQSEALAWEPFAAALAERAHDGGESSTHLLQNVSAIYIDVDCAKGTELAERATAGWAAIRGPRAISTITSRFNTAVAMHTCGRCEEARPIFAEAIADLLEVLGPSHPWPRSMVVAQCVNKACLGDLAGAQACFSEVEVDPVLQPLGHVRATVQISRAWYAVDAGDLDVAEAHLATAASLPSGAEDVVYQLLDGRVALARGDLDRAEQRFRGLVDGHADGALWDFYALEARARLGDVLLARGDREGARSSLEATLALAEAQAGSPCVAAVPSFILARALAAEGSPEERARAVTLARTADEGHARCGHSSDGERRAIAAWLATMRESPPPSSP